MPDYNSITTNNNTNNNNRIIIKLLSFAIILSFIAIMLGAYTRLTNAGLGCPDWPGCYGKMLVSNNIISENGNITKAWTEMIHRYIAGSLGFLIICIVILNLRNKGKELPTLILSGSLLTVLILQALLGMWTVTLKLLPTVVMGHLIGGFVMISLLVLLLLTNFKFNPTIKFNNKLKIISFLTLLIIFIQIILGGWTSANYAALPCLDFPTCNGKLLPSIDNISAMNPFLTIGPNYEGGVLNNAMRNTIQLFHRWGALVSATLLILTALYLRKNNLNYYKSFSNWLFFLLTLQITLGIINVKLALPLVIAILHNSIACLLLISLVTLNYKINYVIIPHNKISKIK